MKRHLVRLAVILAGSTGLVALIQAAAEAGRSPNHSEPLR